MQNIQGVVCAARQRIRIRRP